MALVLSTTIPRGASAADGVSAAALKAVVRALGFVESLPRGGVTIGILFEPAAPGGADQAQRVGQAMSGMSGPGIPSLQARVLSAADLDSAGPLDALFIMPGASIVHGASIAEAVRRRRLISVSTDPECLHMNCCVLFIQAEPRVEIVIDTALAAAADARFSLIFAAMVRRR